MESNEANETETNENQIISPISNKIKVDLKLKYTPEFNEKPKVKQHIENFLGNRLNDDKFKRNTSYLFPYIMCRFADIVYSNYKDGGVNKKYVENFPEGWKFLITAENNSWGNGYFGATFWNPESEQVVIAHRGTTKTNSGAVWTDIKSIYGNKVTSQISSAVTFSHYVQRIFAEVDKDNNTHFKIFITGHSLGAWLAQICTFSLKYLTIMDDDNTYFVRSMEEGHHAHTVVFDSPGCKPMLQQLQREFDVRYDNVEKLPIDFLDIASYLSAPNRVNTCNPHVGKIYRVFIDFSIKSLSYNLQTHKMKNILKTFDEKTGLFKKENGKFKIQEVVDWPETSILNRNEYKEFFKWAKKLNDYNPSSKDVKFKGYYPIRYQTKEFNENQCSLNVFSQSDQQFLKQYQVVRQFSDFFKLNKLFDKKHLEILNKLSIDDSNHLVAIQNESIVELYNTLSYVRQFLIKFPKKIEKLKTWLSNESIAEITYKNVSISYLQLNKKWLKFKICENFEKSLVEFLNNPNKIVWKIEVTSGDTFCTLKQIYCTFLEQIKNESISNYTEKHCIVLDIKNLLQKNQDIKLLDYLKLTKSYNQLLIIEYNPNQFDNNDDLAKMFSSNLFVEIKNSKSCKIILCAKQDQILKNILSTNLDELCKETKAEGFTWNDLNEESQKKLLNRKIVFQEKEKNLNDLIDVFNIKDEIGQLIDHDSLIKLINEDNKIEIGSKNFGIENLEGAYADLYKEVNNKTLKYNLIENSKKAIYFISGLFENNDENRAGIDSLEMLANLFDDFLLKSNKNINIEQTSENAEISFNRINGTVHWIEVKTIGNNNQLVWRDSKGSIQNIRQYINDVEIMEDEDSLVNLIKDKQTIILADDPGMGKSTTLVQLYYSKLKNSSLKIIESNWIIHINLRDHIHTIKSLFNDNIFNIDIIIEFLSKIDSKLSNNISQNLLKYTAKSYTNIPLLISFDGFDELQDSNDRSKIIELLKFLRNYTKVKIWITTRMHYCNDLENALSTIAIKFSPMDKQSIKLFIVEYLKVRLRLILNHQVYERLFVVEKIEFELINEFTEQFLNKIKSIFKDDISRFIGTPLQLHLLLGAKGFIDNFVQWTNNTEQPFNFDYMGIDICSVYEYFIDNKYDILFKKMSNLPNVVQRHLKTQLNDYCMELVTETIFSLVSEKNKTNDIKEIFLSSGLVRLDKENNLKLIHQTFEEYYASEMCINLIKQNDIFDIQTKKIKFVLDVFKQDKYEIIRLFIDIRLNKLKNVIKKTSNKIYKQYGEIINNELKLNHSNLLLNQKGYTVLDIATKEGNLYIVNFLLTSCKKFKKILIKKLLFYNKKENKMTALYMAVKYNNFEIFNELIEMFDSEEYFEVVNDKDINGNTILHLATKNKNNKIIERLILFFDGNNNELIKLIKEKNKYGDSILHLAVKFDNNEIIEKLIPLFDSTNNELIQLIKEKNKYGDSILHIATRINNIEIIEKLIPLFDNNKNELIEWIKDKNLDGESVFHIAGLVNSIEIIERLIPLFDNNKNELIEEIKDKNQYGKSVLHIAGLVNGIEIIERLIPLFDNNKHELIEWIKDKNQDGYSVLHLAAQYKSVETIERLIPLFDNNKHELIEWIKDKNQNGDSVLHIAAQYKSVETIERLIPLFDNNKYELIEWIKDKNSHGFSVLHIAGWKNNIDIIEKLIPLFDNNKSKLIKWIKDKNQNGNSVLHIAGLENSIEIIEKLVPLFYSNRNELIEWIKDKNQYGNSVLHLVVRENNIEVIERLIPLFDNNKNDLIEWIKDKNQYGNSVLHIAGLENNIEIIEKLIPLFDNNQNELIEWIKDKNSHGFSVLHIAGWKNNIEIIEKLIPLFDNNQNELIEWIKDKNSHGFSVLHIAGWKNNIEIIERLIPLFDNNKNDLIEWIKDKNQNGNSVLHIAGLENTIEIIEKLVPLFGSNRIELIEWIKDKNQKGNSVLHIAGLKNSIEIIEKLVPLFYSNRNELIEWIKDKNQFGNSVLHLAVRENNIEVIERLIPLFDNNKNDLIEWIKDKNQYGDSIL
ncbi:hypothetical protein BLOT_016051 [Blomia tropicalis]|nr:hypothetical protein BLOT_016051 [Blomia tropicalis]